MDRTVLNEIYTYWFGDGASDCLDSNRVRIWMAQSDETDTVIRRRFGSLLPEAAAVAWNIDELTREKGVALVVLFDQCPRNLHRMSRKAFVYDHLARDGARRLIATGWHRFTPMERFLLRLPFVRHEDLEGQANALKLASEIVLASTGVQDERHRMLAQAIRHRELIRRFGRFPHRNAMLDRVSAPEESAFLLNTAEGSERRDV